MNNEFYYSANEVDAAILAATNAKIVAEDTIPNINEMIVLANSVEADIEPARDTSILSTLSELDGMDSTITEMKNEAIKSIAIDRLINGDNIVNIINEYSLTSDELFNIGYEYYNAILESSDNPQEALQKLNSNLKYCSNIFKELEKQGLSQEFIASLSDGACKMVIDNDWAYKMEGASNFGVAFIGTMSLFGIKLAYGHHEFDRSYQGFYFGTGEDGAPALGTLDCCNWTDWIARAVFIDIYGWNAEQKFNYCVDGITPSDEILAGADSEYFYNGKKGDYISNGQHIVQIYARDENGYYYVESSDGVELNYATFEQLKAKGMRVTNTDALSRNTAPVHPDEYVWLNEDGSLASSSNGNKTKKENVFALPDWVIDQNNINLTEEQQQKLFAQYDERNKNPNYTGIEIEIRPDKGPINVPSDTVVPDDSGTVDIPNIPDNPSSGTDTPNIPDNPSGGTDTPNIPDNPSGGTDIPNIPGDGGSVDSSPDYNLLPENKFTDVLPSLTFGEIGYMEISNSMVNYEIKDISLTEFEVYSKLFEMDGYKFENGVWSDGTHNVTLTYGNNTMYINLTMIFN